MSFASKIVNSYAPAGSVIALVGVLAAAYATGPVLALGSLDPEAGSVVVKVSASLKTSTLTAQTQVFVSEDGVTYKQLFGLNTPASTTVPAAGTGSSVVTTYYQHIPANLPFKYVRVDVLVGVATGGASDNVTVTYNLRKRAA